MKYSVNVLVYICRLVNSNPNNFSFLWIEEAVNDPGLSPFEMIKFDIVFPSFMCRQLDSSFILYNMKGKIVWERYILGFRTFLPSFPPKIYQNGLNIWNWAFKHLNCLESSNLSWNCKASCFSNHGEGFSSPFFIILWAMREVATGYMSFPVWTLILQNFDWGREVYELMGSQEAGEGVDTGLIR